MKKVLPALAIIFLTTATAQAQISKGSVLLGGGISGYTQNTANSGADEKSRGITITPSVGFVTKTNTVIGFNAGYGRGKTKYDNMPQESESNNYSAGVFLRKYLPLGKNFYLFGEGGLAYNSNKSEQYISGSTNYITTKQSGAGVYIYPGVAYAVSKRFHLEASINNLLSLNYNRSETEQFYTGGSNASKSKGFSFNTNVSSNAPLSLGFRFVPGK